jgi:hypothetical protein
MASASSSSDDHEVDDAELGDVRPFTAILYDDDQDGGAADAESMEDGASAQAAASVDAVPLPTFADAALLPAFQVQQTAASSFKSNPDYLLHLRDNGDGLLAGAVPTFHCYATLH